jgi:hypothetical protein
MSLIASAAVASMTAAQALMSGDVTGAGGAGEVAGQLSGAVGLLNYGVLGILTLGFIRGWVVSPKERERLISDNAELKKENADKDIEIARLNQVMQENLQAMVATTDKQIDLWSRQEQERRRERTGGGPS